MLVTKIEAAKLAGISRATLYNHIKSGKVSVTEGKIDTSELIRVYGALKNPDQTDQPVKKGVESNHVKLDSPSTVQQDMIEQLKSQIEFLKTQLELSQKRSEEEKKILLSIIQQEKEERRFLLAHQKHQEQKKGFFSWLKR